ncbi:MAG TPA: PDZ domain-containing protein, partial [Bacteroidota bacterium]
LKLREEERGIAATERRRDPGENPEPASASSVSVDRLGLTVSALDSKKKKQLEVQQGVVVEKVEPFSPAGNRNILPGDVILSVGEREIDNPSEFKEVIGTMEPGEAVMLRVKNENRRVNYVAIQIPEEKAARK